MKKEPLTIIYFLLGIVFIASEYLEINFLRFISKPLLMPILLYGYILLANAFGIRRNWWFIMALIFSWLGDTFLLMQEFSSTYFLLGLAAFLFAHVFYIICFYKPVLKGPVSRIKALYFTGIVLYAIVFLYFITPYLGDLLIPVVIYAVIIISMLLSALNQHGKIDKEAFRYIFRGAALFVIADSLIAVNKFYAYFNLSTLTNMTFYIFAQYFIMKGIIIRDQNNS